MKRNFSLQLLFALLVGVVPLNVKANIFFSDTFTNGSTLNSAAPANPTATNTAYQVIANKAWLPNPPTMTASDLKMGIGATTSGFFEAQALFATNAIALTQPGDYIQLTVAFTNTSGLLTAAGQLGLGLYSSGQVKPIAGGINNSVPATFTGGSQNWLGYASSLNFSGSASRVLTRPAQTGSTIANQELMAFGITGAYAFPVGAVVGTAAGNATLVAGSNYVEVLKITLNDVNSLAITNTLYAGDGTVITNFGGVATNTTFLTSGFDALAIGYTGRSGSPTPAALLDISSIKVDGSVTTISGPPTIVTQPANVTVATSGSCAFNVAAIGFNVTYQWRRNGTNLLNGGNISGATSSQLIISPAGPADVLSGANGYYVVVTGAGPYSTNSATNSLTLVTAQNLIYSGSGNWDLNTSPSWVGGLMFNYGDAVTFDDTGAGGTVPLVGSYLSASSVTVNANFNYTFSGSGSFAGPGKLIYTGANQLTINNPNTYSGGTLVSNATANLRLGNQTVLGTGPVTLAKAGGQLDLLDVGSASAGLGDVIVQDDFKMIFEKPGTFAVIILGNLSGTTGKTLLINPASSAGGTTNRVRVYGTNTVCNANLVINDGSNGDPANSLTLYGGSTFAPYNPSGSQTYNGVISGVGGLVQRGTGLTVLNAQNTYSGGTYTTAGGIAFGVDSTPTVGTVTSGPIGVSPLYVSPETGSGNGSGTVQANNGARTIANPIQFPTSTNNQTLIIGGTNNLTFTGNFALNGQTDTVTNANRTVQANNSGVFVFAGVISDNSLGFGLIKTGTNALYLNNSGNSYTGPTTNSAGLLSGTGNIPGSVTVATNASIGGGSATVIGSLAVGGNLTFAAGGGGYFRLNTANGQTSDRVNVTGLITNFSTGTNIVVTNLGPTLVVGNSFTLFNKGVTNGNNWSVTGGLGAGLGWTNKLALNGSIQVVQSFATYSTNINYSVSGSTLTISWPATHQGWFLQAQTNNLNAGLGTNWVTIPGTDATTSTNLPVISGNPSVFYRLKMP